MKITIKHKDSFLEIEHNQKLYVSDVERIITASLVQFKETFNTEEK